MVEILVSSAQVLPGGPLDDAQLENPGCLAYNWLTNPANLDFSHYCHYIPQQWSWQRQIWIFQQAILRWSTSNYLST